MLELDPQVFLSNLAADIRTGRITEDEGRKRWGEYNTERARRAIKRMRTIKPKQPE